MGNFQFVVPKVQTELGRNFLGVLCTFALNNFQQQKILHNTPHTTGDLFIYFIQVPVSWNEFKALLKSLQYALSVCKCFLISIRCNVIFLLLLVKLC